MRYTVALLDFPVRVRLAGQRRATELPAAVLESGKVTALFVREAAATAYAKRLNQIVEGDHQ